MLSTNTGLLAKNDANEIPRRFANLLNQFNSMADQAVTLVGQFEQLKLDAEANQFCTAEDVTEIQDVINTAKRALQSAGLLEE